MIGLDFRNTFMKLNRGWRNNNPMNIRYVASNRWLGRVRDNQRKDKAFAEFSNVTYGFRAAFYLLVKYYYKNKLKTPRMIISKWAPTSENDTDAYVKNVMDYMHKNGYRYLEADATLPQPDYNWDLWCKFMVAMTIQESGRMPTDISGDHKMKQFIEKAMEMVLDLKEIIRLTDAEK